MMIVLKTVSSQSSALLSQITKKNKDLTFILVYVMIHLCLQTSDHISFELKTVTVVAETKGSGSLWSLLNKSFV